MPPKAAQKSKKESTPPPQPKKLKASPAPKKKVVHTRLKRDSDATPIDVIYESESKEGQLVKGIYILPLKLEASDAFRLVKTTLFTEGPYAGMQAIIVQPAKPFPFMKLPKEVRARIYNNYLAPGGVIGGNIVLEAKRSYNKSELWAKSYAGGSKERVALLAVNREIHEEATPILYAHTLVFENTTTLLDFISWAPTTVKAALTKLSVNVWQKNSARYALRNLDESTKITSLHFDNSVCCEGDPAKAAKVFHGDAHKFLEAIGTAKGDNTAGVDVLSFGKKAFTYKAKDAKVATPWADEYVDEFKDHLRAKLKPEWKFNPSDFNYFAEIE